MIAAERPQEVLNPNEVVSRVREHFATTEPAYAYRERLQELCENYAPEQLQDALQTWLIMAARPVSAFCDVAPHLIALRTDKYRR